MRACEEDHRRLDGLANGDLQTDAMPPEWHVQGRILWWVYRGSHDGMGEAWGVFGEKVRVALPNGGKGPHGDIYLCDPRDHPDAWGEMLTVLWVDRE